jgi:hypothetical protein
MRDDLHWISHEVVMGTFDGEERNNTANDHCYCNEEKVVI